MSRDEMVELRLRIQALEQELGRLRRLLRELERAVEVLRSPSDDTSMVL